MGIGDRIKERRQKLGLTQQQLANAIGVKNSAISNYESGLSSPREEILFKLFEVLGVDANYLFQDDLPIQNIEITTIAAHHDEDEWTEEELAEIEQFKNFVKMKRGKTQR